VFCVAVVRGVGGRIVCAANAPVLDGDRTRGMWAELCQAQSGRPQPTGRACRLLPAVSQGFVFCSRARGRAQVTRATRPARCWSCWTRSRTRASWTTTWTCRSTCPACSSCAPPSARPPPPPAAPFPKTTPCRAGVHQCRRAAAQLQQSDAEFVRRWTAAGAAAPPCPEPVAGTAARASARAAPGPPGFCALRPGAGRERRGRRARAACWTPSRGRCWTAWRCCASRATSRRRRCRSRGSTWSRRRTATPACPPVRRGPALPSRAACPRALADPALPLWVASPRALADSALPSWVAFPCALADPAPPS